MGEANEERVKDSRGGPASSPSDRHGREAGSGPAPYLQFQSAVLTAAATLGRGKGREARAARAREGSREKAGWEKEAG